MKLTTKGRYAVMAMVDLATSDQDKPIALADIAERQEISLSYLEQLFAKLRRAGLLDSTRGPGGGYKLSRPAAEIRISDIILAADEPIRATRCHTGSPQGCIGGSRCLTHDLWEELSQQVHLYLSSVTLDDVVNRRVIGTAGRQPAQSAPSAVPGSVFEPVAQPAQTERV